MALSGILLFGFVVAHMIGNLQVFLGPEQLNAYARWLHEHRGLLWTMRGGLIVVLLIHIGNALSVVMRARAARPTRYQHYRHSAATMASRTMVFGGIALLAFVAYHLMHLTWGNAHPNFVAADVYCNVVRGFSIWWVSALYAVAQIFLGLHLYHGLWSVFQTLGISSARWDGTFRRIAALACAVIVVGNISMPAAVLTGVISGGICA